MATNVGDLEIGVKVNASGAEAKLKQTKQEIKELEKGDHQIEIGAEISDLVSGIKKAKSLLEKAGLVKGVETVIKVGIDLATSANDKQQTIEKAKSMVGSAYAEVEAYAEKMNKQYGLNKTNTINSLTDVAGAYKGMGLDTGTAMNFAERMNTAALDYAAALNKTPEEVNQTIMSLMRGNTAVADNLSLYGVTADSLKKTAEELKEKGLMPEGMDEQSEKYVALLHKIEQNANQLGFTGAFEREADTFGSQSNRLAEEWKTLKENAGQYLVPAAAWVAGALNDVVSAVAQFIADISGQNVSAAMEGALGTTTFTEEEINARVNEMTAPFAAVQGKINEAKTGLDGALAGYSVSMANLSKTLLTFYGQGLGWGEEGLGDTEITDELSNNLRDYAANMETLLKNEKNYTVETFLALWGMDTGAVDTRGQEIATAIAGYYDNIIQTAKEKQKELDELVTGALLDNNLDQEEMAAIQGKVNEINDLTAQGATADMAAQIAKFEANGQINSMSLEELTTALMTGVEASTQALVADVDRIAPAVIQSVLQNGGTMEEAQGAVGQMYANVYGMRDTQQMSMYNELSRYYMQSLPETEERYFNNVANNGFDNGNNSFQKGIIEPLAAMAPLVEAMRGKEGIGQEGQQFIEYYDKMMQYQGADGEQRWAEDRGISYEELIDDGSAAENLAGSGYTERKESEQEAQEWLRNWALGGEPEKMTVQSDEITVEQPQTVTQEAPEALSAEEMLYQQVQAMYGEDLAGISYEGFLNAYGQLNEDYGTFEQFANPADYLNDLLNGGNSGDLFDIFELAGGNMENAGEGFASQVNSAAANVAAALATPININVNGGGWVGKGTQQRNINAVMHG